MRLRHPRQALTDDEPRPLVGVQYPNLIINQANYADMACAPPPDEERRLAVQRLRGIGGQGRLIFPDLLCLRSQGPGMCSREAAVNSQHFSGDAGRKSRTVANLRNVGEADISIRPVLFCSHKKTARRRLFVMGWGLDWTAVSF